MEAVADPDLNNENCSFGCEKEDLYELRPVNYCFTGQYEELGGRDDEDGMPVLEREIQQQGCQANDNSTNDDDPIPNDASWIYTASDGSFYFRCLWVGCNVAASSKDISLFTNHVQAHCLDILGSLDNDASDNNACMIRCPIYGCVEVVPVRSFKFHISCHRYHALAMMDGYFGLKRSKDPEFHNVRSCGNKVCTSLPPFLESNNCSLSCKYAGCRAEFDDYCEFVKHISYHAAQVDKDEITENGLFQCSWLACDSRISKEKNAIKRHLMTHISARLVACPFCGLLMSRNSTLGRHLKRNAPEITRESVCDVCHRAFADDDLLLEHLDQHLNKYECSHCCFTAADKSTLERHVTARHQMRDRSFICEECGAGFYEARHLTQHLLSHKENTVPCPHCDEKLKYKWMLKNHILRVHEKNFEKKYLCHLCDNAFMRGYSLTRHLVNQHKCPPGFSFGRYTYSKGDDGFYRLHARKIMQLQGCGIGI